ncbi:MAG: SAM-dependent chlorinase/fluorinase [Dehalococcoidales bacterium]|nr:SAM-dependent chlorinase/fluorinase [Dehalococcoidales bacterium]
MVRPIVLLTDFGAGSSYVGEMKGVLAALAPGAAVIDLCHDVRPQDVGEGAFLLGGAWRRFPRGAVFVAVVDPGVGSGRGIVALETLEALFLAPDNGLLSYVWADLVKRETRARLRAVTNRRYFLPQVSATFHGRDVFAPVAAHLARGLPLDLLGPRLAAPRTFPLPQPECLPDGSLRAHVVYADRFGNLVTDLGAADLPPGDLTVEAAGHLIEGLSPSYAQAQGLLAIVDSWQRLEVALRDGNAAQTLGLGPGDAILVRPRP